tara:strand:- start:54 stop:302 length:249 start_codon:yes stop_codon:yes gene_type:complete
MKQIKHTEKLTLTINLDEFNKWAIPLVDDIEEKIKNELYYVANGIIDGQIPAGYTWEGMFYRSLKEQKIINFTELGRQNFEI